MGAFSCTINLCHAQSEATQRPCTAQVNFRRQHAIGNFIVDFVSIKNKLAIELGGSQHLDQVQYDIERSKYFESQGYKVVRFWNNQVENDINGVIRTIELALKCDPIN